MEERYNDNNVVRRCGRARLSWERSVKLLYIKALRNCCQIDPEGQTARPSWRMVLATNIIGGRNSDSAFTAPRMSCRTESGHHICGIILSRNIGNEANDRIQSRQVKNRYITIDSTLLTEGQWHDDVQIRIDLNDANVCCNLCRSTRR